LSARRAVIRLWVVGTFVWITFWLWNYTTKCVSSQKGVLFCPTASGDALQRTDYPHAAYLIFGPSVLTLIAGLFFLWLLRASRAHLESR
jgi:hypothetical protein